MCGDYVLNLYINYLRKIVQRFGTVSIFKCFEFLKICAIDKDFLSCMYFGCDSQARQMETYFVCMFVFKGIMR